MTTIISVTDHKHIANSREEAIGYSICLTDHEISTSLDIKINEVEGRWIVNYKIVERNYDSFV